MPQSLIVLLIVAVALYLLNTYLGLDAKLLRVINIVVVALTLAWLVARVVLPRFG